MNIILISKYASILKWGKPTRQYFYSKQLAKSGHNVKLILSRSNGENTKQKLKRNWISYAENNLDSVMLNGPIVNLGFNIKRLFSWIIFEINLFRYFKNIKKFNPDIIVVSSLSILTFIFGVFIKKRLKIPLVLEIRDLYPLTLIEVGGMSNWNPFVFILRKIERYGYKNADLIISTLENTESYFKEIKKDKLNFLWLPMGFNEKMYSNTPDNKTNSIIEQIKHKKDKGSFIVGYAGSFGTANALNELMEITKDTNIRNAKIQFVFIGDGPLKELFKNKFGGTNTSFFPNVSKKYLPSILKHCDILVNTWLSKPIYRFGISPNKWIDYMYAGRPILLALDANSQIFNDAKCGWQIPAQNKDKLKNALLYAKDKTPDDLNRIGLNGKDYLIKNLNYEFLTQNLIFKLEKTISNFELIKR